MFHRWTSSAIMMGVGFVLVIVAAVIIAFNLFTVPAPVGSPTVQRPTVVKASNPWPYPVIMPEDIGRLESEVYKVCEQYANLDLSGMVQLCKRVGFQE